MKAVFQMDFVIWFESFLVIHPTDKQCPVVYKTCPSVPIFLKMIALLMLMSSTFIHINGLPGVSEYALRPSRYRKLPIYNCSELYTVNGSEIERIVSELKTLKEKKYDLVVLNYTVNLDCLFDDEMKYVRQFLVNEKGKNILRYAVEAGYFPLKNFGLKSTIQNVNIIAFPANSSSHSEHVVTLQNLTLISQTISGKSGFTDVCFSVWDEKVFNFAALIFIPKSSVLSNNGILCQQKDGRVKRVETSGLVYAIYGLSILVTLHINLFYGLILEEIEHRRGDWKIYHKDETPFSLFRLFLRILNVAKQNKSDNNSSNNDLETINKITLRDFVVVFLALPIALLYHCLLYINAWAENIIFFNDEDTFNYIINTYSAPISQNSLFIDIVIRLLYYVFFLAFLCFPVSAFNSISRNDIIFTLFKPDIVFTYELNESGYSRISKRGNPSFSPSSHFVKSYKQLFCRQFWFILKQVSTSVPSTFSLRYAKKLSNDEQNHRRCFVCGACVCIFILHLTAFFERCFYIVCAVVNLCVNIKFVFIQTFCPLLKYFFTGYAQRISNYCSVFPTITSRYKYALGMFIVYVVLWCGVNLFVFHTVMVFSSYVLYLTIVAIPFNPAYGVSLLIIILSILSYLLMFYEDFQSDYKHLLDVIFEILDDHFVEKIPDSDVSPTDSFNLKTSTKVRQIDAELFDQLSKKYIPFSRKCAFLFVKLAFTAMFIVIAFNALQESGTRIETLKVSDFFSVILLVMIPGIVRNLTGPRETLRKTRLSFEVFRYLKMLDKKHKLESMVKLESDENFSDSEVDVDNVANSDEASTSSIEQTSA